ncbi:MAG: tetratricopeptide repeat protein [Balneolales bacterium]
MRQYDNIKPLCTPLSVLLLFLLLVTGCSNTLKSGWTDFNAYFNTYYNGKTSFDRGVSQVRSQREDINPERPIGVYQKPVQTAQEDFIIAIEKSADILRFHPTSGYVDKAIEMIGKSYFYQGRFFPASQKFLELYATTSSEKTRQRAVLWRGRSLIELENYNEGLSYLQSQLFSSDYEWDDEIKSGINLLIGQLYVHNREWEDAARYLSEGLEGVNDRELRARANFLHGQVLEKLGQEREAFRAYDRASDPANPDFSVTYHAMKKKGQMARKTGDYQWAYDFFVSMTRDDKFFEYQGDLLYEVARTLQESGDYAGAMEEYDDLLHQNLHSPGRESIAKTYFGLAEIYRDHYQDYTLAAAYYDSSAQQIADLSRLPEDFNARLLADSYGAYANLIDRVQRLDSLLHLGSLPDEEFDAAIASVREQKVQEAEQQEAELQSTDDRMIMAEDIEPTDAAEETENGFLNHRNARVMNQVSQAFTAYWGPRPLIDNWRRAEAVRIAVINRTNNGDGTPATESGGQVIDEMLEEEEEGAGDGQVIVDLSDIPFTEEERAETREQIAETYYEIGNVFFLTLNMPDSAIQRYTGVIEKFPDSRLAPQAMYSLSETYHSVSDTVKSREVAENLIEKYPESRFAKQIAESHRITLEETVMNRQDSLDQRYRDILDDLDESPSEANAERLKTFAATYPDSEKASLALYQAATEFISLARGGDGPNRKSLYEGAYWDSTRVVLADISKNYASFPAMARVELLQEEIQAEGGMFTGDQLDEIPELIGGVEELLNQSGLQQQINSMSISTTYRLTVTVDKTGQPTGVRPAAENEDHSDLRDELIEAILVHARFTPPLAGGQPVNARFEWDIPVKYDEFRR